MRSYFRMATLATTLLLTAAAFSQVRGTGRLQGTVVDKSNGKTIEGATVTVAFSRENTQPIVVKTDGKGHWSALGLVSGQWNIDIAATGYQTSRGTANVSEMQRLPPIRTELAPEEAPQAAVVETTPLIPKDAVEAINEGQSVLRAAAANDAEAKENAKKAVADFEKALPLIPTDKPEAVAVRNQLMEVMAQAYYKAGDLPKAIASLEQLDVADPWVAGSAPKTQRELLLANLYLENGALDKGKAIVEKLPATAVTDPTVYVNLGILFLNKRNPADAVTYFTRAINLDPKRAEGYYYRGLALLQEKKSPEAKADLEQVLVIAPDSPEANDAKQLLAGLK